MKNMSIELTFVQDIVVDKMFFINNGKTAIQQCTIKPYLVVISITMFQCFIHTFNIILSRYSALVMLPTSNVVETQKKNQARAC